MLKAVSPDSVPEAVLTDLAIELLSAPQSVTNTIDALIDLALEQTSGPPRINAVALILRLLPAELTTEALSKLLTKVLWAVPRALNHLLLCSIYLFGQRRNIK